MKRYVYWAVLALVGMSMVLPFGTAYVDFGPSQPNGAPDAVFRGWDFLAATLFGNWLGLMVLSTGSFSILSFSNLVPLGTVLALLAAARGMDMKRPAVWLTALITLCLATSFINAASFNVVVHPWEIGAWVWRLGIFALLMARLMVSRSNPQAGSAGLDGARG